MMRNGFEMASLAQHRCATLACLSDVCAEEFLKMQARRWPGSIDMHSKNVTVRRARHILTHYMAVADPRESAKGLPPKVVDLALLYLVWHPHYSSP